MVGSDDNSVWEILIANWKRTTKLLCQHFRWKLYCLTKSIHSTAAFSLDLLLSTTFSWLIYVKNTWQLMSSLLKAFVSMSVHCIGSYLIITMSPHTHTHTHAHTHTHTHTHTGLPGWTDTVPQWFPRDRRPGWSPLDSWRCLHRHLLH